MQKGNTFNPNDNLAILIVGNPGTRKTTLALQFPKPYIFDADDNISGPVRHLNLADFAYDHATRDDKGNEIPPLKRYAHFVKCINEAATHPEIDTIIIDSLTAMVDILCYEVKRQAQKAWDAQMTLPDWGKFAALIKHVVLTVRSCGKTVIFTGHNQIEKDEASQSFMTFLAVPGQAKGTLSGMFTDCWLAETKVTQRGVNKEVKYTITTVPASNNDQRGVKSSLGFKQETFPNSYEPVRAILEARK